MTTHPHPEKAAPLRLLALDVDGVLTDGALIYLPTGEEAKAFNVKDGHGLRMLQKAGVTVAIITGRDSPAVTHRARDLGIPHVFQAVRDKGATLAALMTELGLSADQVAAMGDDLPDLPMLQAAGLAACPADAVAEVRAVCDFVSLSAGGRGAVRELCEWILAAKASP